MTEAAVIGGLLGAGIAILFMRLAAIERRLDRVSRIDAKLDAVLRHSGIRFDELEDVPAGVREALQQGHTVLAIKRFLQATGAGLKEAKEFVEEVRRRGVAGS
jgi:ribosomal protein L7/L12